MDSAFICELLRPFLASSPSAEQLNHISTYIDLLLRWNARINLTAVRPPEEIVTRHFGESLFAARHLLPASKLDPAKKVGQLIDIGSGAGFPGLAIKIWAPELHVTLIESNHKKAMFLREVIRSLTLMNVDVFAGRAEDFHTPGELVTLRAVECFERILPTAVRLVAGNGRLALLIGEAQVQLSRDLAPQLRWLEPLPIPLSSKRVLFVGRRNSD